MHSSTWPATALALLAAFGVALAALAPSARSGQGDDSHAMGGEWLYVEDLTEGRPSEEQQPPMSVASASIGFINGGRPQHFELTREAD